MSCLVFCYVLFSVILFINYLYCCVLLAFCCVLAFACVVFCWSCKLPVVSYVIVRTCRVLCPSGVAPTSVSSHTINNALVAKAVALNRLPALENMANGNRM